MMSFRYWLEIVVLALAVMVLIAGIVTVIWLIKLFPIGFLVALVVLAFALSAFDWAKGGV